MQRSRCTFPDEIIEQLLYFLSLYWRNTCHASVCAQITWGNLFKCRF